MFILSFDMTMLMMVLCTQKINVGKFCSSKCMSWNSPNGWNPFQPRTIFINWLLSSIIYSRLKMFCINIVCIRSFSNICSNSYLAFSIWNKSNESCSHLLLLLELARLIKLCQFCCIDTFALIYKLGVLQRLCNTFIIMFGRT